MGNPEDKSGWYIYFAVITASLSALATGSCASWTSPLLPKFQSTDPQINPIGSPVTISESAWIVSALNLGLFLGPPISIVGLKYSTKKTVLLISLVPTFLAHVICCFAFETFIFILARFLMGIGNGLVWTVLGTYIAEIAEDRIRGLLGCIPGTMSNLGSLLVYIIGPYVGMTVFSVALIIPLIIFYITFGFFVPNSPYDLLTKDKCNEAESSLKTLRKTENVEKELAFMKETIVFECSKKVRLIDLLKDRGLRKGLVICVALMCFQQLSGIIAVVSYAEVIFLFAGDFIPPSYCPILLGIVGTMGNLANLFLVDKLGRKVLLASSCALESITLFALGLYFYLLKFDFDVSAISWLPLVSLMLFMTAFNLGLGIVPWIVTGEVFHSAIKPLASNIAALNNFAWSFVITMCFPYMITYIGMDWTFWIFAISMVIGFVFCVTILPETKGKNFQEIQKILKQ